MLVVGLFASEYKANIKLAPFETHYPYISNSYPDKMTQLGKLEFGHR